MNKYITPDIVLPIHLLFAQGELLTQQGVSPSCWPCWPSCFPSHPSLQILLQSWQRPAQANCCPWGVSFLPETSCMANPDGFFPSGSCSSNCWLPLQRFHVRRRRRGRTPFLNSHAAWGNILCKYPHISSSGSSSCSQWVNAMCRATCPCCRSLAGIFFPLNLSSSEISLETLKLFCGPHYCPQ